MATQNSTLPTGDYQKEYQKLRTKRIVEILKSADMSNDDFLFLDKFIQTYFADASKALKNVLAQDALKKVYKGTQYKELEINDVVFDNTETLKYFVLVISGKIDIAEDKKDDPAAASVVKSYSKGEFINPNDMSSLTQTTKNLKATCAEKSEILIYEREHYESVIREFSSAATNTKLKAVSKNFLKIKKMDRSSKEEFLTYFKPEKFTKGTVVVNFKSKVEEIYVLQSGKIAICIPTEGIPSYHHGKIVIGVLGPENIFNEWPLLFEKPSPYYAICLEDTEVLSLGKSNLNFVADNDTFSDLRANAQCKQRLQSTLLDKYKKINASAEIEKHQAQISEKVGVKLKDIMDIFEKFDPKSKNSLQFAKNLEKFNKATEKPFQTRTLNTGPMQKFSEYATPRLVSKDPNFRNLDPQRQMALLTLRNEGASRRAGNPIPQKDIRTMNKTEIMKMQNRLLGEEKAECERITQKTSIGNKLNLNKVEEESKASLDDRKGLFNKMKLDNKALLANMGVGSGPSKEEEEKPVAKPEEKPVPKLEEKPAPKPEENDPTATPTTATPSEETPTTGVSSEVKPEAAITNKILSESDEVGLIKTQKDFAKKDLANLLGVNAGPKIRAQPDIVNKKRTNLLKNPNLL